MPTWLETQRAKVTRATSRSSYSQAAASAVSGNGESTTSESVAAGEVANSSTGVGSTPPVTTPSSTLVQPPTAAVVSSVDATVVSEADPSPSTVFSGETTTATTVGAAVGATTTTTTATAATATPPSVIITSLEQSGAVAGESNSGDTTAAAAAAAAPAEGATVGGSPPVVVIPPSPGKRMGSFSFRNLPSIVAAAFSPSSQSGSSRLPWGRNKSKETKNGSDKSSSSAAGSASQMSHSAVNETSSAEGSDVEGSDNDRQQQKQQPQPQPQQQQQQQSQQQQQQDVSTVTVVRSGSVQRQATSPLSKSIVTGETGEDEDMDDVEISSPPSMNMGSPLSKVYPSGVGLSPDGRLLSKRALEIQAEEGVHSLFRDASTVASDLDDNGIFSGIVNGKASIALSQPLFENASSQSPAASAMYRHPALASTADSLSRPVALSHRTSFHQLGSTTSGSGGSVIAATTTPLAQLLQSLRDRFIIQCARLFYQVD
ncbi:hypothetical protein GQ42DRAFT_42379 [Ramicandelaber brevisporus]|nr:hypothetical protein GQ42DRAFT_42379 [Ramicandelaber brevisporus]